MKLRIRSMATKDTLRVDAPDSSSLRDLKTLIAGKLSSSSSSSPPIDPESIHLSLNRKDELLAPSSPAADSLPSLGLTSGDLLFYSLSPFSQTLVPPNPPSSDSSGPVQTLGSKPEDRMEVDADGTAGTAGTLDSKPEGRMEVDLEPAVVVKKPSLVPRILRRVMDLEKGENEGILGRLVITIHAAFLDSGFLVGRGGDGSRLPPNWASDASNLSVQYTLRDPMGRMEEKDVKLSIVRYSVMGNFVTVYGYISVEHPDVYRVCIDGSKIAPFLSLAMDSMSERDEKEMLKLWNMVKDGLCSPLLIDICSKNGLPLPPCFMRLSRDLKTDILELVPGADLARIGCTCSEMSAICSDDKFWKKKFEKEFGSSSRAEVQGTSWRERFAAAWIEKKNASKMSSRRVIRSGVLTDRRFNPTRPIFPVRPHRYPIIGGDYDLYQAIGNLSPQGAGLRNSRNPARREFSPPCNFGGYSRGGFG